MPNRRIIWLSKTYSGSVHDKKICDFQPLHLTTGINLWQDTGFQGHNPENVTVIMPMKKPKGRVSTIQQQRLDALNEQGYKAVVCYGFDESIKTIKDYEQIKCIRKRV